MWVAGTNGGEGRFSSRTVLVAVAVAIRSCGWARWPAGRGRRRGSKPPAKQDTAGTSHRPRPTDRLRITSAALLVFPGRSPSAPFALLSLTMAMPFPVLHLRPTHPSSSVPQVVACAATSRLLTSPAARVHTAQKPRSRALISPCPPTSLYQARLHRLLPSP